jgi:hypothetical protein
MSPGQRSAKRAIVFNQVVKYEARFRRGTANWQPASEVSALGNNTFNEFNEFNEFKKPKT